MKVRRNYVFVSASSNCIGPAASTRMIGGWSPLADAILAGQLIPVS